MPHLAGVNALHEDVLCVVLLLETSIARGWGVLKAVAGTTVRCPQSVLTGYPHEDFAFEGGPATPNATGGRGMCESNAEPRVGRTCGVFARGVAGPYKLIRLVNVSLHRGNGLS